MSNKIYLIANSLSIGGAERISGLLAKWFSENGFDTTLVTIFSDKSRGYELPPSVNRITIDDRKELSKVDIIIKLRKYFKDNQNSTILVMGVPLSIYVIPAIIGLKISTVISERNDPKNFAGKKITKFLSRALMFKANGFVFQTEGAKEHYHKIIQKKSIVIPNPIMADNLPTPFSGVRSKRIVSVGRLDPQKNHKLLINAFGEISHLYPEYSLVIYGEGKERPFIEELIQKYDLDNRVYLPGISHNVFNDINDASLFVLSSDFEGMPNALIEAMALGIPSISTDCPPGGPRSLITNMANGVLVPVNNYKEMANAMRLLLSEKNKAEEIGKEASKIRDYLNKDNVCKIWSNYLKSFN